MTFGVLGTRRKRWNSKRRATRLSSHACHVLDGAHPFSLRNGSPGTRPLEIKLPNSFQNVLGHDLAIENFIAQASYKKHPWELVSWGNRGVTVVETCNVNGAPILGLWTTVASLRLSPGRTNSMPKLELVALPFCKGIPRAALN